MPAFSKTNLDIVLFLLPDFCGPRHAKTYYSQGKNHIGAVVFYLKAYCIKNTLMIMEGNFGWNGRSLRNTYMVYQEVYLQLFLISPHFMADLLRVH